MMWRRRRWKTVRASSIWVLILSVLIALVPMEAGAQTSPPTPGAPSASVTAGQVEPHEVQATQIQRGNRTAQVHALKTTKAASGAKVVADRLIVGFRTNVSATEQLSVHGRAAAAGAGKATPVALIGPSAQLVDVSGAASLEAAMRAYKADPRVAYAEYDYVVEATEVADASGPLAVPNDPLFSQEWGLTKIQAPAAWDTTKGSSSVVVAVVDCGIHEQGSVAPGYGFAGHPDINGKVVLRQNFSASTYGADDLCDHGTHVAGTIAALTNNARGVAGVGWNVSLMNVKVLGDDGSGSSATIDQGIMFAADHGAKVINLSVGGDAGGACPADQQQAVDYAWSKGSVVVAAAGNDSKPYALSPASCNHALSVAATDQSDNKASFSHYNPTTVHVAAPGVSILSTLSWWSNDDWSDACLSYEDCYGVKDGTSMATPHVSGLAGLLWSTPYGTSNQAVVDRIRNTADKIAGTGVYWASGRINALAAVSSPPPPVIDTSHVVIDATGYVTSTGLSQVAMLASPQRLADTRSSGGPIGAGQSRCFPITGLGGIPADAGAVVLNVTAVGYASNGWLTLFPSGQPVPATSTVNFDSDQYAIANNAIVKIGSGGYVCVNAGNAAAHAILDATGYVTSTGLSQVAMLPSPQRLADTRAVGGIVGANQTRCFQVAGLGGIPANAAAALLNVTAVGYGSNGWLTLFPAGQAVPPTSTVNFDSDEYAIANGAVVTLGGGGYVCVNSGNAASHVILDATGYVTSGATSVAMLPTPVRLVDTRTSGGPIAGAQSRCFTLAGVGGIPANAGAVLLNVTGVAYTNNGWLTLFPNGQPVPATSTVNFDKDEYGIANGAIASIGYSGQICVNVGIGG